MTTLTPYRSRLSHPGPTNSDSCRTSVKTERQKSEAMGVLETERTRDVSAQVVPGTTGGLRRPFQDLARTVGCGEAGRLPDETYTYQGRSGVRVTPHTVSVLGPPH